jgi:hypothetical protein
VADFDYHTRRLGARLLLVGSDPGVSRSLMRRWALAAGKGGAAVVEGLRLPLVPLADLAGFDLEVEVEVESGSSRRSAEPDACVLVIGGGTCRPHVLRILQRRGRESVSSGPVLWAALNGWDEALSDAARRLGVEDDILRARAGTSEGALICLEVALACLIDHALLRVHPATWGDGAPEPAAVVQRVRGWVGGLSVPGGWEPQPSAALHEGALTASPEEPWRRRALDLQGIEPLPAADAELEVRNLEQILKLTPADATSLRRTRETELETDSSRRRTGRR